MDKIEIHAKSSWSVVVVDNMPHHSVSAEKITTKHSIIKDNTIFIKKKCVHYDENKRKEESVSLLTVRNLKFPESTNKLVFQV